MKIEIVEFYPIDLPFNPSNFRGSLHIYLCDLGMDIRGIVIKRQKAKWYVYMPHFNAKDPETGECVRYPHISFTDEAKRAELRTFLRKEGRKFIEDNFIKNKRK